MKPTAFYNQHVALGGKIVDFAGFAMPIQYAGIIEEHRCVRTGVGVFDVSHMGEVEVWGRDALEFVQRVTINDASRLVEGRVQYSAMCYDDGGIVDDLLVYHMGDHFLLVVNAANTAKDLAWLQGHLAGDVRLKDRSDEISLLAVQGPQSLRTLQKLTGADLAALPYYHFFRDRLAGVHMIISRTGYTGELGFELYFPSDAATGDRVWKAVMEAGREFGITAVGLGARDTLRLEMGYCLYGHDIDQTTNPLEAGLGWITKLGKGPFIGRGPIQQVKERGTSRRLVGFLHADRAFPRQGYPIHAGGTPVGAVTSGTFSPTLGCGIGMGYVPPALADPGTSVTVQIRGQQVPATVVPFPFVKR